MGYLITAIAIVFLVSAVVILLVGGPGRTKETAADRESSHGLGPDQPQDEGATLPQARERLQSTPSEPRS